MIDFSNVSALDSETTPISPGILAPPLSVISTCDEKLDPQLHRWCDSFEILRDLYRDRYLVLQNGAYDAAVFAAQFPELMPVIFQAYLDGRVVDTMLNERLIHIAQGRLNGEKDRNGAWTDYRYNLKDMALRYGLGSLDKDTYRLLYGTVRDLPLDRWHEAAPAGVDPLEWAAGMQQYPKEDARTTFQVFAKQTYFEDYLEDAAAQARAAFALQLAACRGVVTDARQCQDFFDLTKAEIERAEKSLIEEGLLRIVGKQAGSKDTKLAKALMERVCAEIGIPVPMTKKTKTSKATWKPGVSLNAEACNNTGDATLMDYALYTSADKAYTVCEALAKGSQGIPLQSRFEVLLKTGRISSSEPNLTNLHRAPGLRECIVPRQGFVLCSLDLDMAEAVGVAQIHYWLWGESTLGEAIKNKKDIHCHLAAELMGCPYEEVLLNKKHGRYKLERQNAKFGNYGAWGLMGPPKFTATTNAKIKRKEDKISLETGIRVINAWRNAWAPETFKYKEWVQKMLGDGKATFRHFVSGRVRGGLDYSEAANNPFQGLIADGIKAALLPICHEMYCVRESPLFGSRLLLDLHDEIFAELVEEKAHEAAFRLQKILLDTFNSTYTPSVPMTGEPCLMKRWRKATPSLYVHGELVPAKPQVDGRDVIVIRDEDEEKVVWVPDL